MDKPLMATEKPTDHFLRAWRHDNCWSLGKLAKELGVTPAHLSQIEHHKGRASWDLSLRLAQITGLDANKFYVPRRKYRNDNDLAVGD